jgi:FkbH-like protein
VAVVHLGTDPAFFLERLDSGCWFDLQTYTAEDVGRSKSYTARRAAIEEQAQFTNLGDYLSSLNMVGQLYRPAESELPRIAQLEQKTNQFNLTGKRYSETDIRRFFEQDDTVLLAFRLSDRFGDQGLVSSIVARQVNSVLKIDSWVMSCRIFSRSAEQFMLRGVIELARERGIEVIEGFYEPSPRNGVVADLYSRLGFQATNRDSWERPIADSVVDDLVTHIGPGERSLGSPMESRRRAV